MQLLLDTHALLWWWTNDTQLSETARLAIASEANDVYVSAASAWEISTKQRIGKLGMPDAVRRYDELLAADGFAGLPISPLHALHAGTAEAVHRDPFDRMLAAQAELNSMVLVTCDPAFALFDCRTLC